MRQPTFRPMAVAAPSDALARARHRGLALIALVLPPLLASCGGGYDNGFGCYNCNINTAPTEFSFAVASADLNNDGMADIVQTSEVLPATSANPASVKSYLATAPGVFASANYATAGDDPIWIAIGDMNGDGYKDVVTASAETGTVSVFFNNKTAPGTFNTPLQLSSPGASQVVVHDMNGDGMLDIVSADFNVSLFLQTSPGTFAAPILLYPGGANWVAVGDLNGDGAPDVVVTDEVGVKLLLHTGAASATTFAAPVSVFTQTANANVSGANIVAIGDVDGDGLNDLVITDPGPTGGMAPTVNVLRQDPSNHGSFLAAVSYLIATQDLPQSILLVDLTGAGKLDIVIGGQNSVTVLLHDPANPGKFLPASMYSAPGANEIAVADVNGDGKLDIVVSNGVTQPVVNGVVTAHPGVLLQSTTTPGTFGALQDLP